MTPEDQDCIAELQDHLIYNDPLYKQGFQAGAASRDAEIAKLKEQNWELISEKAPALVAVRKERDQLRAQINVLREAGVALLNYVGAANSMLGAISMRQAIATTPEQSLAEYRNKVIEAFVNEFSRHVGGDGEFWLHELQDFAMKEQP